MPTKTNHPKPSLIAQVLYYFLHMTIPSQSESAILKPAPPKFQEVEKQSKGQKPPKRRPATPPKTPAVAMLFSFAILESSTAMEVSQVIKNPPNTAAKRLAGFVFAVLGSAVLSVATLFCRPGEASTLPNFKEKTWEFRRLLVLPYGVFRSPWSLSPARQKKSRWLPGMLLEDLPSPNHGL